VRAATVAGVDGARRGHVEGAREVVTGALAVELARAEVDVRGAVAVDPRLGLKAVGAGITRVECDRLKESEHFCTSTKSQLTTKKMITFKCTILLCRFYYSCNEASVRVDLPTTRVHMQLVFKVCLHLCFSFSKSACVAACVAYAFCESIN